MLWLSRSLIKKEFDQRSTANIWNGNSNWNVCDNKKLNKYDDKYNKYLIIFDNKYLWQ